MAIELSRFDTNVRLHIYRTFLRQGRAPTVSETARALRTTPTEARVAYRRLGRSHVIVLQEGSGEILRAAPFWAVPTAFRVEVGKRAWWGSCAWDALGIPAMLGKGARISSGCGCCDSAIELRVTDGHVSGDSAVIHFAVPAQHWYDNIVFT